MNLEKNLAVYTNDVDKDRIRNATPPQWYVPTKGKNGDKSFSVLKAGKLFEAFDPAAPRKYAKEVAESLPLSKTEALVLIGAGEGHIMDRILRKAEPGFVLVLVEPCTYLLREAFSNYNFSKHLATKKLILATNAGEVTAALSYTETFSVVENWGIVVNPYVAMVPETYFEISDYVGHSLNSIRCNTGTMAGAGAVIAHNDLANLPYMVQYPGVVELKDIYKGRPAVVVSTGPSLERNVHLLLDPKVRERVVVVCVAQAVRILLAYGITPDYMCTVDYGEVNASHFAGLEECGIPLIALNRTYAPIFESWKSPIYVATSMQQPRDSVSDVWISRGGVEQGGSVSHFAFGVAVHLGCSPVALMGQDLAYEGDQSHCKLADSSGGLTIKDGLIDWKVDDPRSTLFGKDYAMGPALPVEGYFGETVVTNTGLASFIHSFSVLAEALKKRVRCYDCTEGGALIPGFRPTTLKSYLDRFARHAFPHVQETFRYTDTWRDDVGVALRYCEADAANLQELLGYCKTGLETCDTLETFIGNKHRNSLKEFDEAGKQNLHASNEAQKRAARNPLLESAIYGASREIAGKELFVSGKHTGKDDHALETRIKRNRHILNASVSAAKKLLEIYTRVEEQLKELLENPEAMRGGKVPEPSLSDAAQYLQKGNWGLPLLELQRMPIHAVALFGVDKAEDIRQRCEEMRAAAIERGRHWQEDQEDRERRLRYHLLITEAKKAGSRQKDFRRSYLYLLRAHRLQPSDMMAVYGIASCATMLKKYDAALPFYDRLVTEHPDVEQYKYERMLVLLSAGDVDNGFRELEELLARSEKYDHVLFTVADIFADVKKDKDRAAQTMRQYLEKYPQNPEGWRKLWEWSGDEKAKSRWQRLSR